MRVPKVSGPNVRGRRDQNQTFELCLPLKLGPGGLGTLMGESGVKFRVGLHPPRGRETLIRAFLGQKTALFLADVGFLGDDQ